MAEKEFYRLQRVTGNETLEDVNLVVGRDSIVYDNIETSFVASLNSSGNAADYYFKYAEVSPYDFDKPWSIRFLIRVEYDPEGGYSASYNNNETVSKNLRGVYEFKLWGVGESAPTYQAINSMVSTSYRPIYNHVYKGSKNENFSHCVGFRMISSYDLRYGRKIKVYVMEASGCTFSLMGEVVSQSDFENSTSGHPIYNDSNYGGVTAYTGTSNGIYGTSVTSTDTYDRTLHNVAKEMGEDLYRYKIIVEGKDGRFYPLTTTNQANTTQVNKEPTSAPLLVGGKILYYNTTATIASGNTVVSTYNEMNVTTLVYNFNQTNGYELYRPLYIVGIPQEDGSFKIDNSTDGSGNFVNFYTQTLPATEDGKLYITLGLIYAQNRIRLNDDHPIYEFKDGALRLYVPSHKHSEYITEHQSLDGYVTIATDQTITGTKTFKNNNGLSITNTLGTKTATFKIGVGGCLEVVFA